MSLNMSHAMRLPMSSVMRLWVSNGWLPYQKMIWLMRVMIGSFYFKVVCVDLYASLLTHTSG